MREKWYRPLAFVFKGHVSKGWDCRGAFRMMQMLFDVGSQRGAHTNSHKSIHANSRHTLQSSFPGCTRWGLCPRHNSVLSCQDASHLAAEYSLSVIGADRDCRGECVCVVCLCVQMCVCVHTCRVEWNSSLPFCSCSYQYWSILLKWTSAT